MNSEIFRLNLKDFAKSFLVCVLMATVTFVYESMLGCGSINCVVWDDVLNAGILASLAYLIKNFLTDGSDQFVGIL